ncbi:MAG: methylmalonyl-CoA mutase subunit beta [Thalassobaculum sp.]|uniref:methylmalonyl-CoA mutase subunit beta n=1 Tax=Thalassobaculum sp. TaxID=2022740 RepID=UPI0032EC862A
MTDGSTESLTLAADFPAADRDQWRALVEKALKGVPYEKALVGELAEGIRTEPIYTRDDAIAPPAAARHVPSTSEGAVERTALGWDVRTLHAHPDPAATNAAILADLAAGANSVALRFDAGGQLGHTARTGGDFSGSGGVMIDGIDALDRALDGVYLEAATAALEPGAAFLPAAALMTGLWERRGIAGDQARGHLGADPLGALASLGTAGEPVDAALARMAEIAAVLHDRFPNATAVSVDSSPYHAAGADEALDLGYALATGVAYLRAMETAGLAPADAARQMVFCLPVGVDVFLGIAKLRAARALWARVLEACGVPEGQRGMTLHVTTAPRAWAGRDAWVNMLRATVATFAAATGGADSLTVLPYTHALGLPDGFARRIARNTQLVLKEESHLARVVDPAGGSWYVEMLTDKLAERAWGHFQAIEAAGGMAKALLSGSVARACAEAWSARERRIARRREELTGVNAFPKVDEVPVDVAAVDRDALVAAARERLGDGSDPLPGDASVEDRARAAEAGVDLSALMPAGPVEPEIAPLPAHRLGEAFEELRDACDAAQTKTGRRPRALLLGLGGAASYTARATFARNHLGTGGIEAVDAELDDPGQANQILKDAAADLVVICSSDSIYADRAAAVAGALKAAGASRVWLAGRPGDREAEWQAAGIDGYLFAGDDTLATLRGLLSDLGVWSPEGGSE